MKYLISLLLIFSFSINTAFSQRLEEFTLGVKYIDELKDFMTASKNSSMEDLYKDFDKLYKSDFFTVEQKDTIQSISNLMLAQRMTANPFFSEYLQALMKVKNAENGDERFNRWHQVLRTLLTQSDNTKKSFQNFVGFSIDYFENSALKSSKSGVNWIVRSGKDIIEIENGDAIVKFDRLDLLAARKTDTILIMQTGGYFSTNEQMWYGKGGRVTWERVGLESNVFVELDTYAVDVKRSIYTAENVTMHYPLYFGNERVEGSFSDKLVVQNEATEGSYPRFESKASSLDIKNIGEGVNYRGGFRLHGTTVYGVGTSDNPSMVTLYNKRGSLVYRGLSDLFTIKREERIVGERVESTLYFGQDSIYHPSVNVRFEIPDKKLQLTRGQRGSDRNPFTNSLHQMNIISDRMEYLVESDSIFIGKKSIGFAKSVTPSVFESLKFFEEGDYRRLQNISTTNPIALMKVAYLEVGDRVLDADYLAKKLNPKYSVENINSLLYDLVAKGFINYDSENQQVELKDKIFHYADASQKKVDFDNLRITSETDETNAVMSLQDNFIKVRGVQNVEFSQAQKVGVKPFDNEVTIKDNRDLDFSGKLFSGFTVATGKDFHFSYNKYDIALDSVDYFDIYIPTGKVTKEGQPEAYGLGSRIENLSGVLLIDAPSNKSGNENIELFPSLQSKTNSYVYYENEAIQKGVYLRDSFYFQLNPFSFNSLDRFGPSDVQFKGKMFSADIFPVFDETLVIKEDSSLGFFTKTPSAGFPAYQGKGSYIGTIDLSNQGFKGQGFLTYLGASLESNDLIFRPKQLVGSAERFDLEEDRSGEVEVPQVRGYDITMDWRPYKDSMYIKSEGSPFELFQEGRHKLEGTLILTPGGLKGFGLFDWDKANMTSKMFSFGAHSAWSDTTNLKIKAFDADAIALSTNNLNGRVDFDEQIGNFKANADFLTTTLPYNQYETSFNKFDWDMKEETVTFKVDEGKTGSFLSIHPDQDSLRFNGTAALYDLKSNVLKIGGVPYIITSDAFVYPETGDIEISPGAVMSELTNAKIIADTLSKYHVINKATVNILGRKEYRASGYYEYNIGDKEQEIEFKEIIGTRIGKGKRSEKRSVTRAKGDINIRDQFYIDHKTLFQGTINLNADQPNLGFDGFAKMESKTLPAVHWFSIQCEGDKNDLAINYKTPLNPEGESLHVGLFLSKETASMYPTVLMPKYFRKDRPILAVNGFMQYDEKRDVFSFGDSLRIFGNEKEFRGNLLTYNNTKGELAMEGKLELGSGLKHVKVDASGKVNTMFGEMVVDTLLGVSAMNSKTSIEAMLGMNVIIPDNLLKIMVNDLKASSFDATPIIYTSDLNFYKMAAENFFPKSEEMDKAIYGLALGSFAIPKKQNEYTFLFGKTPMIWDVDYQSFVSTQEKLPLISVNGEPIGNNVTSYVEVKMPTNDDDRLYIYLKSPSQLYYFFGYKQGILNVVSNNTRFMDEVLGMKDKDRIIKMGDDDVYEIQAVEPSTANAFVNRVLAVSK